jgi:KDO2-lipid IV(A) lauroyltransferase
LGSRRAAPASVEPPLSGLLGSLIGWIAGSVLRIRRQHVERAMIAAGIVRSQVPRAASAMYRSLGRSLVEALWLAANPSRSAWAHATIDEWSRVQLEDARRAGRGFVLATAHTGNWELAAAALAELFPVTAVVKRMHVGMIDRLTRAARTARGIALVTPDDVVRRVGGALARGEGVLMVIDQVPDRGEHAVEGEFLSGRVDVDRSPAALAARAGVPLVLGVSRRMRDGEQRLEVLAVFRPPANGRLAWTQETMKAATRALDRWVHAHPSEWLWMHRRWRRAPRVPARDATHRTRAAA